MKKIISASRRNDIIANNYDAFLATIKRGEITLQNPFFPAKFYTVSLRPEDVAVMVLWSKDFSNFVKNPANLGDYNLYFQYTINCYDQTIEKVIGLEQTLLNLQWLFTNFTADCVTVRFDPVFFQNTNNINNTLRVAMDERLGAFENLLTKIKQTTHQTCRIVTSYLDLNPMINRQLAKNKIVLFHPSSREISEFFRQMKDIADHLGFVLESCADQRLRAAGISIAGCINHKVLTRNYSATITKAIDQAQRKDCLCIKSTDIGIYPYLTGGQPCVHQCKYCYVKGNILGQ